MNVADMKTKHAGDDIESHIQYVPTLVVALHPDISRIGETAPLLSLSQDGRDYLSRNRPDFSKNGRAGRSLCEPRISRSPIIIQQDSQDTFRVRAHTTSTTVEIAGRAEQSEYLLSRADIGSGVVMTLNKTVVLLLKLLPLQDVRIHKESLLKGISPDIRALNSKLENVARMDIPVMIRGLAGSGKEQAAYKVHSDSPRADKPFVNVNLAAIHDVVAAEELFGSLHKQAQNPGYFSQADGGTLVLEDIEDASEQVIELLFSAIKNGYYLPLQSDVPKPINCRLVLTSVYDSCPCAVDSRLWQLTNALSAYQVFLPPLAERVEDLSLLFIHFVEEQWHRLYPDRAFNLNIPTDLMGQLMAFHWPGNVRQLRNVARQVVIDSREASTLQLDPQLLSILKPQSRQRTERIGANGNARKPNSISREELSEALENNRFELQATARELAISRASVYQLIQRFEGLSTAQDLDEAELRNCYQKYRGDTEQMMWELRVSQVGMRRRLKAMGYDI
ncbi:sigma-54-dependent Fis family transcriptional regulator [Idiomarina seosinensis]|uniref:Sigma-54-dependent Fis family transcriptional regulator n=2 Tax=Idiomarina seosinensis TaxID=281739 RepID=A0A432ZC46_9GAMM|nr:sigma-54-dependent Fis family transcriptional regulator [Idiomarina seosinensis]